VVGTPGAWVWDDNFRLGDGDYLVLDLKNYYDTSSSSTFSQSGPFYQLDHVCHRLPVIITVKAVPCSSPLDHF